MWDRRAKVLAVKDGDTLRVQLDQGFGDTKTLDLRLFEVYAPEKKQTGGPETRAFVERWISERSEGEWPFIVTTIRTKGDEHEVTTLGRYVAVFDSSTGESLNNAITAFVSEHGYGHGIGGQEVAPCP